MRVFGALTTCIVENLCIIWPFAYMDSQLQIENTTYFFPETFENKLWTS